MVHGSITAGPDGALWITEGAGDRIGRVATNGAVTDFATGITPGGHPTGITLGPDGKLWFTEPDAATIGQIATDGTVAEFALRASVGPNDITNGPDGNLWFTEGGADKIGRITPFNKAIVEFYLPNPTSDPAGITVGPDNALWFAEFGGDRIGRILISGSITEFTLTSGAAPRDITIGADGNLWFTEAGADQIGRITTAGVVTEFVVPGTGSTPLGITAGPDGRLWFTEFGSDQIGAITTAGVVSEFVLPGVGSGPLDIAAGQDGRLWFTEFLANQIGVIIPVGVVTEFNVPTANSGPTGIASGLDGALWFTEVNASRIGRATLAGVITEITSGITAAAGLAGITSGPDGNLWFAESTAGQIGRVGITADLAVTKTDGRTGVRPGAPITYTIVVSSSPDSFVPANGATITDTFPAILTGVTWTAVFSGGATGNAAGTGNIAETVNLPPGGMITYTVTAMVPLTARGLITNSVVVSSPPDAPDVITATNFAFDNTAIEVHLIVTGAGPGGGPHVQAFDGVTGALVQSFFAYDMAFRGGVTVAAADVTGDGADDIITGAGPGGGPHVKVFDGLSGMLLGSFFAYDAAFRGGVNVAGADVDGNGPAEIITGAGAGGGPHVRVFSVSGFGLGSFFAYDLAFRGGVNVGSGDVTGDGLAEVITGAGAGGGPHVKVLTPGGLVLASLFAYDATFRGGVSVAAGDVTGDGRSDVITGPGFGLAPEVRLFDGAALLTGVLKPLAAFLAYDAAFRGGVRVAADELSGAVADIITGAGPGGGPHVKVFRGDDQSEIRSFFPYDPRFGGGVFVG